MPGYHMKWKPALLGSWTACFGVMLCLKHQDTLSHPLAGWDTWLYFTELQTLLPPFALLPSLSLAELENCLPYPGCYPHLVTATVFCSPEYTHSPPLAESAASHLETSRAAGSGA